VLENLSYDPGREEAEQAGRIVAQSSEEKAELQKRVNSLVDKWAVQHTERLKAAKRRRTPSK